MVSIVLNDVIINVWPRKCDWLVENEACRVKFQIGHLSLYELQIVVNCILVFCEFKMCSYGLIRVGKKHENLCVLNS